MANELAKAILGSGGVRFNLYDFVAQKYAGLGDLLETDKFEITPDAELKRKTSKSRNRYGQNIASTAIAKPTKIAITLSGLSAAALAMQYQGTLSQAALMRMLSWTSPAHTWPTTGCSSVVAPGHRFVHRLSLKVKTRWTASMWRWKPMRPSSCPTRALTGWPTTSTASSWRVN